MKGIGIVERHFEKAVLGVVALAIGGLVAFDLLSPTKAKIGGKQVVVAEVRGELQKAADAITAAQGGTEVPFQMPEVPAGEAAAVAPLNTAAAPGDPLPRVMPPLASGLFSGATRPVPLYHEPSFAAPKMISPVAQSDGAVKVTPGKDDDLVAFLDRRPAGWDKGDANVIWTTPAAELDLAAVRAELERAEADANPPRESLPLHWWQQRDRSVWILDVHFEREERLPDGTWSNATEVETLPKVLTFRDRTITSPSEIAEALRKNAGMREGILRPMPPTLIAGVPVDPRGAEHAAAESKELTVARRRLGDAQKQLDKTTAELEKLGGEYYDPPADGKGKGKGKDKGGSGGDSGQGGGAGGGKSGGGGMGPSAGGSGGGSDSNSPEAIRRRKAKTRERDGARADVKRLEDQVSSMAKASEPAAGGAKPADPAQDRALVWAHDFQVRPGATYRYRCRVDVANPFLGRKGELQESQRARDGQKSIATAASAWSTVHIRNPREVFAVEGMPGEGPSGLGLARFQVFRLDKGLWRDGREVSELGDRVGSAGQGGGAPDFTTDWFVVAVYRDLAADAEARRAGEAGADRRMIVVLANAKDPSQIVVRRPAADDASPEMAELLGKSSKNRAPGDAGSNAPSSGGKKG